MTTETALLAAIADGSPGAHEVYADWLVERGDPRGELIHVQLARETVPTDPLLEARERELFAAHLATWLPGDQFWLDRTPEVTWRRGFLDGAVFGSSYEAASAQGYAEVAVLPVAAMLRELEFHAPYSHHGEGADDDMIVEALLAAPPPPSLRTLVLTCGDRQRAWSHLGNVARIFPLIPGVERFVVDAGRVELGAIALPRCRTLTVINSGMRGHVLRDLAAASWPHLERLELFLGNGNYGADCTLEDVARLLATSFPKLTSLGLTGCELGDEVAPVIAQAPLLRQLRTLDLSSSTMGPSAADAMLAHADRFAHLESLDLSANFFRSTTELATLCREVVVGMQHEEIPNYGRYVDGAE